MMNVIPYMLAAAVLGLAIGVVITRYLLSDGVIDLRRPVPNTRHKFGEAAEYYRGAVIDLAGNPQNGLFTGDQVREALLRAARNPEDA